MYYTCIFFFYLEPIFRVMSYDQWPQQGTGSFTMEAPRCLSEPTSGIVASVCEWLAWLPAGCKFISASFLHKREELQKRQPSGAPIVKYYVCVFFLAFFSIFLHTTFQLEAVKWCRGTRICTHSDPMIYKGRGLLQDKRQERDTYTMKEKESKCNVKSIGSELKRSARGNINLNGTT